MKHRSFLPTLMTGLALLVATASVTAGGPSPDSRIVLLDRDFPKLTKLIRARIE